MPRTLTGTSHTTYRDEDLTVDWTITRGRPQALNEPAEDDEITVTRIQIEQDGAMMDCLDDLFDAFVQDEAVLKALMEDAIEEAIRQKEEAFDMSM